MRRSLILIALVFLALGSGCESELLNADMPLSIAPPAGHTIDSASGNRLTGIYAVHAGAETFGDTLVGLWVNGELCLYSGAEVIFIENAGTFTDDSALSFNGYYRFVRSARMGTITMHISPPEGGSAILRAASASVTIRGSYQDASKGWRDIQFVRVRSIRDRGSFEIIGHSTGGRNSDRLGRSENSIELARFAEYLGCTGVECDLHVTADDSVILMHDDDFSPRTVETTYILGPVANFTLRQIRRNARLIHGEQLPTLYEFLTFVVDSTHLDLVWLDPKVTRDIPQMLRIVKSSVDRAKRRGRTFRVIFGIPSSDMLNAFEQAPLHDSVECLVEYSPDVASSIASCVAYGPRWTLGVQADVVNRLHPKRMVFPWTIDSPDYMTQFLNDADFDGILTDYSSMLAGNYYLR